MRRREFGTFPTWFLVLMVLGAVASAYLRYRYDVWFIRHVRAAA